MILAELVKRFSTIRELPIEITEVRDAIISLGVQDTIVFCPDESMDVTVLRGVYYQYTRRDGVYGEPVLCSLIAFSKSVPLAWQRLISCKELMHIIDNSAEKTKTLEELDGLLNRLLGPLSSEDFDLFDIMAAKDRLALYQAIPILFPDAARADAIAAIATGKYTEEKIAERACLPARFIRLALRDEWPALIDALCC